LGEFRRLAEERAPRRTKAPEDDDVAVMIEPLTPREEEVLQLLAEGLSNKEIGARLHLTEGTVKNYVSAIIAKLQANDRTHAVITALRRGLVEL
jgi:RNA polymerase sigma factor (sigma-70 family)